jgi:hypothetical protein
MPFEQYLKNVSSYQDLQKDSSIDVGDLNTQEAILETYSNHDSLSKDDFEASELPLEISLVVTLRPQKLIDVKGDYSFSFTSREYAFKTITYADLKDEMAAACCSAVDLIWQGEGSQKAENSLVEPLCEELQSNTLGRFHRKCFTLPPGDFFFCEEIFSDEGQWVYKCPLWEAVKLEEHPLIPCGGFFHKGLDLDMIMPMYAFTCASGDTTAVSIKGQSYWQRSGVYPGRRGKVSDRFYSLVPLMEPLVQTSLAQDVRAGKIQFGPSDALYVSYDYDFIDPETNTILLHLKQG